MPPKFSWSLTVFVEHGITAKAMKTLESHNLINYPVFNSKIYFVIVIYFSRRSMVEHGRKNVLIRTNCPLKQILEQYIIFVSRRARVVLFSFARSYRTLNIIVHSVSLVRSNISNDWQFSRSAFI